MRLGIAHHLGWAVAVTASADYRVVDRRRIELVEPGVATAPVEHECKLLEDAAAAALVARVRASAIRVASASLAQLAAELPEPIVSMSLRSWPLDFPEDIAVQRRPPYDAQADSVMYRQVLAELAHARGWAVHLYDARGRAGDPPAGSRMTRSRQPTMLLTNSGPGRLRRWPAPEICCVLYGLDVMKGPFLTDFVRKGPFITSGSGQLCPFAADLSRF